MKRKKFQHWVNTNRRLTRQVGLCFSIFVLLFCYVFYFPNTHFKALTADFYVKEDQSYYQLKTKLVSENIIKNSWSFELAALFYHLEQDYQLGLFQIPKNSSNREILLLLTKQPKKNVLAEIRSYRKRKNVLARFCKKLDIKYSALSDALTDTLFIKELGPEFNSENIYSIFIPDTIPVFKSARAKEVLFQLVRHYKQFWNIDRETKAARLGLTCEEVCVLASIVEAETNHDDEMPCIAGLYLNRLQNGKRLQADPTISYILGHSVRRIKRRHTRIHSPYNTYRKRGLPPGPVFTPSIAAIDAILNAEQHDYYFFCAKPDRSGYHTFSKTYKEHLEISKIYHSHLNKRGIK